MSYTINYDPFNDSIDLTNVPLDASGADGDDFQFSTNLADISDSIHITTTKGTLEVIRLGEFSYDISGDGTFHLNVYKNNLGEPWTVDYDSTFSNIQVLFPDSSGSMDFVLDGLDTSFNMDVSGGETPIPVMDVSAMAIFYVKTSDFRNVFRFKTSSKNISSLGGVSDLEYYIDSNAWPADLILNPCHAMLDATASSGAVLTNGVTGDPYPSNKMLVKHDFARYLSQKLFNNPYATDIFNNVEELQQDLASKGRTVWNGIYSKLQAASLGTNNQGYFTNDDVSGNNYTKQLLSQIQRQRSERLVASNENHTMNDTSDIQDVPLLDGDSIAFKINVNPAVGQHELTGVEEFKGRTYGIKIILSSSASNTVVNDQYNGSPSPYNNDFPYHTNNGSTG
jgi:hypothetical protein